jgi:hypothetical protein
MSDESGNSAARIVLGVVSAAVGGVVTGFALRAIGAIPPAAVIVLTVLVGAGIGFLVVHLQVRHAVGRAERFARDSGNEIIQEVMMEDVKKIRRDLHLEPWKGALIGGAVAVGIGYLLTITVFASSIYALA